MVCRQRDAAACRNSVYFGVYASGRLCQVRTLKFALSDFRLAGSKVKPRRLRKYPTSRSGSRNYDKKMYDQKVNVIFIDK